ncbi:hypothetical protein C4577_06410 [Candidatus Parcubacteria bacterium]|nr:MAG: hypothetical protein C4577_06410 [Candidatus Parcubacteria bacterium]
MNYLLIRNPGVAPIEGFTVLGVSTTRYTGDSNVIGQFGTGSKHAITLLLRNAINPIIYTGTNRLEFFTKPLSVNDGLSSHDYSQVCVRYGNAAPKDLSFTLENGIYDWTSVAMALREFVANALDRSWRQFDNFDNVEIKVVNNPRAKSDYTSVFIPLTPDVQKFYMELPKRFLHFSEKHNLKKRLLPKSNRNLTPGKQTTMVYKKGVFVREYSENELSSVYDYNLGDELRLDESRNVDDYSIKMVIAKSIANASASELVPIIKAVVNDQKTFESSLDSYYLKDSFASDDTKKKQEKEWTTAWEYVTGKDGIVCGTGSHIAEHIRRKGFSPFTIRSDSWYTALGYHGVRNDNKVLDDLEKKGATTSPPTPDMIEALDKVWNLLTKVNMTKDKPKPPVMAFTEVMNGESYRLGYYDPKEAKVFIHTEIGVGQSAMLLGTMLEEVVHHVTGSGDMSRDLQNYLFMLVVKMGLE